MPKVLGRKYNSDIYASYVDELVSRLVPDEELGDETYGQWSLYEGDFINDLAEIAEEDDDELTDEEMAYLEDHLEGGVVVYRGAGDGFVEVNFYDTESGLRSAWADARKAAEEAERATAEDEDGAESVSEMGDEEVEKFCVTGRRSNKTDDDDDDEDFYEDDEDDEDDDEDDDDEEYFGRGGYGSFDDDDDDDDYDDYEDDGGYDPTDSRDD